MAVSERPRLWTPPSPELIVPEGQIARDKDPRSNRAYLFISGGLGANHGLVGIEKAFREVTGSRDVKVMNSVVSMDVPNPKRHEEQAIFIKEQLEAGREVEVVTHSLGSLEATRAINLILKEDAHFFDDSALAGRLTLNYTASSGFDRGAIHEAKFLAKYIALGGSVNTGINAVTAFPPQNMSNEELADGVRFIFGKEKPEGMLPFEDTDGNYEKLPDQIQDLLIVSDAQLKEALEREKKLAARNRLKHRGKIVSGELQKVFDGKYVDVGIEDDTLDIAPSVDFLYLAKQDHVQSSLREMLTKSIYTTTQFMLDKGVHLKVVGLEQDRAITRSSMQYFVDNTATPHNRGEISYVELMGHSGIVLQAGYYVDAITRRKGEEYPVI